MHCDLNNFYASVECLDDPTLRGVPVAVCGDPDKRHGIVLAKNELAKACGVKTAEAIWQAKQKCANLVCVPPHYERYVEMSKRVREVYYTFTDRIEPFGLDECWLDVTASQKLFGDGKTIADSIRQRVKEETGLTISVGVSFTKAFSKLGSDLKKPDATTVIDRNNFRKVVWPLGVTEMLMVGQKTAKKLRALNIFTLGDLATASESVLTSVFGVNGKKLHEMANGTSEDTVALFDESAPVKSVGHGTTTMRDLRTEEEAHSVISFLADHVGTRLRRYGLLANGVSLSLRNCELESFSRQVRLADSTDSAKTIERAAVELLRAHYPLATSLPLRTVTVTAIDLVKPSEGIQTSLFSEENKRHALSESLDKIRARFGYNAVMRGSLLYNSFITDDRHEEDDFLPFQRH